MYEDENIQSLWGELCVSSDLLIAQKLYTDVCSLSALQRARQTVVEYAFKAESSVRVLEPSPHRDALISLVQNLLEELKERMEEHKGRQS